MRIGTRIKIAGALVICVLLAYGAVLLYLDRTMSQLSQEVKKSNEIVNNITILRNLTQDYLLYHTERARRQWSAVYGEVLRLLDEREYRLLNSEYGIGDAPQKLKIVGDTFSRLMNSETTAGTDNPDEGRPRGVAKPADHAIAPGHPGPADPFFKPERSNSVRNGSSSQRLSSILDILALSLLGMLLLSNAVFLQRAVIKPVLKLHAGAEIIGAGNLNYQVATTSKDEIGELSRAFDRMTANLQKVTVSRDELIKEMAERRRVQAELAETLRQKEEALAQSKHLASFPQLNPNPVVEFDTQGEDHLRQPGGRKSPGTIGPRHWPAGFPAGRLGGDSAGPQGEGRE